MASRAVFLVLLACGLMGAVHAVNPWDGVVGCWPFSGNAEDTSGNSIPTTVVGASLTTDRHGNANHAYSFDGSNDYMITGTGPSYTPPTALQLQNNFTFSAWIYPEGVQSGSNELGHIMGTQYDGGPKHGASMHLDFRSHLGGGVGHIHMQIGNGQWHAVNSIQLPPQNQWSHIVVSRMAGQDWNFYLNGVKGTHTFEGPNSNWNGVIDYGGTNWQIGRQKDLGRYFKGRIDDVVVFDRVLSDDEVNAVYQRQMINGLSCEPIASCSDGTPNDPSVPLASPVLTSATIASNNYQLVITVDQRYNSIEAHFPSAGAACDYDSDAGDNADWTSSVGGSCTYTKTFSRLAQDTLASCGFVRSTNPVNGFYEYDATLTVVTNQTRTIQHEQNLRNQTYFETKSTQFLLRVRVPVNFDISHTGVTVTGNITVLQGVTQFDIDADTNPYTLSFQLLTSSQGPYKLTYNNIATSADLGNTVTADAPDCQDTGALTECVQIFSFSDLQITTTCPTKNSLNDEITVTFNVGCKPSFTGNCQTPSPATIGVTFTLTSQQYCQRTNAVTLSATLGVHRNVDIQDTSDWTAASSTSQFVIGSVLYAVGKVTVGQNAATLATTKITKAVTHGQGPVTVYNSDFQNGGEYTGAQLDAKVTASQAEYPAGSHSVSGDDLTFTTTSNFQILYRMPLATAGTLSATSVLTVEIDASWTKLTSDNDFGIAITDGNRVAGVQIGDQNELWLISATGGSGSILVSPSYPSQGSYTLVSFPHKYTFTLSPSSQTYRIRNAAGHNKLATTTHTLDFSQQISLLLLGNDQNEVYRVHYVNVRVASGEHGTEVENGDILNHGTVNWPSDHTQARIAVPMEHGKTVDLDIRTDVEQPLVLEVTLETTYTVSSKRHNSPLLQKWEDDHSGRSHREELTAVESQGTAASTTVTGYAGTVTGGTTPGQPSASGSGSVAGMSTMTVAAVGGVVAVLVILVAYRAGFSRDLDESTNKDTDTEEGPQVELTASSSTTQLDV